MDKGRVEVSTTGAPAAIGPYSQAIRFNQMLFCSGQIPLDPESGEVVGSEIGEQTAQVMKNIEAVLKQEGLKFKDVLKTTVYLKNLQEFAAFNIVYEEYLSAPFPARACIEVSNLPRDVRVEIETIACYPN